MPASAQPESWVWSCEAEYRLPVAEWRLMMNQFLPGGGWIRVSRETLDALAASL